MARPSLIVAALLILVPGWVFSLDPGFEPIFGGAPRGSLVQTLSGTEVRALLRLAGARQWNLFDLLDEACLDLQTRGKRVSVAGDTLRGLAKDFVLGDHRVDTLLPLAELISVTLGSRFGADADVQIVLARPVSGFLELGDFFLADHYGFRTVRPKELADAYGLRVKNGLFTWDLAKIVRVPDPTGHADPNFVAIYLNGFPRPKQWQIDPVRVRTEPTPKPSGSSPTSTQK